MAHAAIFVCMLAVALAASPVSAATFDATFKSAAFVGDIVVTAGPGFNQVKLDVTFPEKLASDKPKFDTKAVFETFGLPKDFSNVTDFRIMNVLYNPAAGYPQYKGEVDDQPATAETGVNVGYSSGPDKCLTCFFFVSFTWLDDPSPISSKCAGYPNSTSTVCWISATASNSSGFAAVSEVKGGGKSKAYLYKSSKGGPIVVPANATVGSNRPDNETTPFALKTIGTLMVPPITFKSPWQIVPFIGTYGGKEVSVGLVIPASLIVMAYNGIPGPNQSWWQNVTDKANLTTDFATYDMAVTKGSLYANTTYTSISSNPLSSTFNVAFYAKGSLRLYQLTSSIIVLMVLVASAALL